MKSPGMVAESPGIIFSILNIEMPFDSEGCEYTLTQRDIDEERDAIIRRNQIEMAKLYNTIERDFTERLIQDRLDKEDIARRDAFRLQLQKRKEYAIWYKGEEKRKEKEYKLLLKEEAKAKSKAERDIKKKEVAEKKSYYRKKKVETYTVLQL